MPPAPGVGARGPAGRGGPRRPGAALGAARGPALRSPGGGRVRAGSRAAAPSPAPGAPRPPGSVLRLARSPARPRRPPGRGEQTGPSPRRCPRAAGASGAAEPLRANCPSLSSGDGGSGAPAPGAARVCGRARSAPPGLSLPLPAARLAASCLQREAGAPGQGAGRTAWTRAPVAASRRSRSGGLAVAPPARLPARRPGAQRAGGAAGLRDGR